MFACDVKKVVAFSTLRQMGFVLVVLCFGLLEFGFYYLVVHGLFKALMFISVGCVMVLGNHKQDFRILSGVWVLSPVVSLRLFVRVFSLSGLPFLSGFYVKDVILGKFLFFPSNGILGGGFFFAVFLTVVYSFRLFSILFLGMKKFFCALNSLDLLVLIFVPLYGVLMFFGYYGFVLDLR
jgi:NADH:ubiquinone oxidoreductase subunit 5 (subunit L)/multisubunit Na+/H+ antiporter MnhA subunit